jgi:uncharacterized membrane protein YoaT (DUF817 family)
MSLDPMWLLLSLIPSGAGFVLFVYGKKQERMPQLVAGLVLMIYPYFATGIATLVGIGAAVALALWYVVRLGW